MKTVKSRAGDTVGLLLHIHLGRDDDEVEQALFEVNPGLAKHGPILPAGVDIVLPELAPPPVRKVVQVWD